MNFIVDLVLVALIILVVAAAVKKGFVGTAIDTFSVVISAFATYKIFKPVSQWVYDNIVYDMVRTKLIRSIEDSYGGLDFAAKISRMTKCLPENGVRFAKSLGLNVDALINSVPAETDNKQLVDAFLNNVANEVIFFLVEVVMFILLFIVLSVVIKLVGNLLSNILNKLPLVGTVNKLAGCAFGFVKAGAIVLVLCTVMFYLLNSSDNPDIIAAINGSRIYAFVAERNPIAELILN